LDLKWGASDRFRVQDPKYNVIVPVGVFGKMGIQINDSRTFLTRIVGTLQKRETDAIQRYMEGLVVQNSVIAPDNGFFVRHYKSHIFLV